MKIWLPYLKCNTGQDVYVKLLEKSLSKQGVLAETTTYNKMYQYSPWLLSPKQPEDSSLTLANSWTGFAFKKPETPLVIVEHHSVFDPAYMKHKNAAQTIYHEIFIKYFEKKSFAAADKIIAVSQYTAQILQQHMRVKNVEVIFNGIDTEYFRPLEHKIKNDKIVILYIGNATKRKGADIVSNIADKLGSNYEIQYTGGLRGDHPFHGGKNMKPLGRLTQDELRKSYQGCDMLLFPSRLEGFGYVVAEAMACGKPVIVSDSSSLPELVEHEVSGFICRTEHIEDYLAAITTLSENTLLRETMGATARIQAENKFSLSVMAEQYIKLFQSI